MNNTNLIGNLTKKPHFIPGKEDKSAVAFLTVAHNENNEVVYVPVTVFGKTAEYVNKHLDKGSFVAIEGKLAQRPQTTQNGDKYQELYLVGKRLKNLKPTSNQTEQGQ